MCGIVCYVGKKQARPILLEGLKQLEYRGYDSAGIAIQHRDTVQCHRAVGKIAELEGKLNGISIKGTVGIAHTRWATHGEPTEVNAHPHRDWDENVFLIHNGIIENFHSLRKKLEKEGLVEGQLEKAERGPARKVYRATPEGFATLRQSTLDALATLPHPTSPLQLGLSNLPIISPTEAITALEAHRQALIERIEGVQATWDRQRPLPYFVDAMFDHGLTMAQAELAWIEKFIKQVEEQNG